MYAGSNSQLYAAMTIFGFASTSSAIRWLQAALTKLRPHGSDGSPIVEIFRRRVIVRGAV